MTTPSTLVATRRPGYVCAKFIMYSHSKPKVRGKFLHCGSMNTEPEAVATGSNLSHKASGVTLPGRYSATM